MPLFCFVSDSGWKYNNWVRQGVQKKMLQGVKVGYKGFVTNMFQSANDKQMFMCEDSIQNMLVIKNIIRCFELSSDLKN